MERGRPVVYVNEMRWQRLPEPVRTFIYEHEAAHHALGHKPRPDAAPGGFLRPAYAPEQEAAADLHAARAIAARGALAEFKQVLAFLDTAAASTAYPLPPQRIEQIAESLAQVFEHPVAALDPEAVAFLRPETRELDWHETNEPFETERSKPHRLQYKAIYRNTGPNPLRCTVVFVSGQRLDKRRWLATDADVYSVELKPHNSFIARGNLTWYETRNGERVFHDFYDEDKPGFVSCVFPPGTPRPPQRVTADYPTALPKLLEQSPSGFVSLRGALESEEAVYKSLLRLPGMEECEVEITTNSLPEYKCTTADTNERQTVEGQYQALVKALKEALPAGWETSEDVNSKNRKRFDAWLKDRKETGPTIRVWTMHFEATSKRPERHKVIFILRPAALD
jgi:hypothetical protein